jgi:hypothetical protein
MHHRIKLLGGPLNMKMNHTNICSHILMYTMDEMPVWEICSQLAEDLELYELPPEAYFETARDILMLLLQHGYARLYRRNRFRRYAAEFIGPERAAELVAQPHNWSRPDDTASRDCLYLHRTEEGMYWLDCQFSASPPAIPGTVTS